MTPSKRALVRAHMEKLGYVYEESGRGVASLIASTAEFVSGLAVTLLWAFLLAIVAGAIFGTAGYVVGFFAALLGVMWHPLGSLVLTWLCSAVPGAVIAGLLLLLLGGPFFVWWFVATLAIVVTVWAKTVSAPAAASAASIPAVHGNAAPSQAAELENLGYLE